MSEPFEILSHTADIGVRAYGRTLPEAYENAARGMISLIVANETVRPVETEVVEASGADAVDLLIVWLHEILYRFDARKRLYAEVHVEEFGEWRLRARLVGEPVDRHRHELGMEIKAVTYHAARVERTDDGWVAEVLFDI